MICFAILPVTQVGVWYESPKKPSPAEFENPTRDLTDLVKMCNSAARFGRGDILWLSYQVSSADAKLNNRAKPQFGNLAWAMTARGAAAILARFPSGQAASSSSSAPVSPPAGFEPSANPSGGPPARAQPEQASEMIGPYLVGPVGRRLEDNHWDIAMRKLIEGREGAVMRAGYVSPPIGNFAEHPGSFDKQYEKKGRPPCWHQTWCCEGTRPEEDRHGHYRQRWVCGHTEKGNPEFIGVIQAVDDDSQLWLSHWTGPPEEHPATEDQFLERPQRDTRRKPRGAAARRDRVPPPPPPRPVWRPVGSVEPSATLAERAAAAGPPPPPPPPPPDVAALIASRADGDLPPETTRQRRLKRDFELQRGRRRWVRSEAEARCIIRELVTSILEIVVVPG